MIKIENFKESGIEGVVKGMHRTFILPKTDSFTDGYGIFHLGENDHGILLEESKSCTPESTLMRHIALTMDVTAPLMWWRQMDKYSIGESPTHTLMERELTLDDFAHDGMDELIILGEYKSNDWWEIEPETVLQERIEKINKLIKLYNEYKSSVDGIKNEGKLIQIERLVELTLPESYLQKRTITMNYAILRRIYHECYCTPHKILEWLQFCEIALDKIKFKEFIESDCEYISFDTRKAVINSLFPNGIIRHL